MSSTVASDTFREAAAAFGTGVAVITAEGAAGPAGLAVQSFASLSLDPPYVTFSPARTSTSWPLIRAAGRFAVNVLAHDQAALSRRFATSGGDKFDGTEWAPGENGAPVLAGALACFEAELEDELPGGDHTIVIGRVTRAVALRDAEPLLYFRRAYRRLVPA
ncbi:flavin reductase family protein [Streptomyces sp. NPDC048659]|uniref:flavin reductase family protein n=1 Tax=Streptomyces sp. NPDC048659 TaxID=3155489 RepID=UPI003418D032